MAAIAGMPADLSALPTPVLVEALAKTLAGLHALPVAACPFDETVDMRLARAETAVNAGDIDPAEFEPRNSAVAPADLLRRLRAERPHGGDIVVLHGDLTLGNIIIDDSGTVGFIDCGNAGQGDRYIDLALLHADIAAHRGAAAAALFLRLYGVADFDAARARYFLDLYELF
jgi:aminoglycoside phosphotransferase